MLACRKITRIAFLLGALLPFFGGALEFGPEHCGNYVMLLRKYGKLPEKSFYLLADCSNRRFAKVYSPAENRNYSVPYTELQLLDLHENSGDFEITQLGLKEMLQDNYHAPVFLLAASRGGDVRMQRMLTIRHIVLTTLVQIRRKLRRSTAAPDNDAGVAVLKNDYSDTVNKALTILEQTVKDRDFLSGTALFRVLEKEISRCEFLQRESGELQREIRKNLEEMRQLIVSEYQGSFGSWKKNDRNLESFNNLFPGAAGLWRMSPPMDFDELCKRSFRAFRAGFKLDKISSVADFPEWGKAWLEIHAMLPNTTIQLSGPVGSTRFRTAMQQYKDKLKNGTN